MIIIDNISPEFQDIQHHSFVNTLSESSIITNVHANTHPPEKYICLVECQEVYENGIWQPLQIAVAHFEYCNQSQPNIKRAQINLSQHKFFGGFCRPIESVNIFKGCTMWTLEMSIVF